MEILTKNALFVTKNGIEITESTNGNIPAVKIVYDNGSFRYILVNKLPTFAFVTQLIEIECEEIMCNVPGFSSNISVENPKDRIFPMGKMIIDMNRYVFAQTVIERNEVSGAFTTPTVDDLSREILATVPVLDSEGMPVIPAETHEVSYDPKQYHQMARPNAIPNYLYWFMYLKNTVVSPILNQILNYAK